MLSGVAIAATVIAGGAVAGTGQRTAVTTVKAVSGPPAIKVNRYLQDNLRWNRDVYKVQSGGTIHVVNMAADEGPHTFTIVKKADAPRTGLQAVNCRSATSLRSRTGRTRTAGAAEVPVPRGRRRTATPPNVDKPGDSGHHG